jgi:hypothetical protein
MRKYKVQLNKNEPVDVSKLAKVNKNFFMLHLKFHFSFACVYFLAGHFARFIQWHICVHSIYCWRLSHSEISRDSKCAHFAGHSDNHFRFVCMSHILRDFVLHNSSHFASSLFLQAHSQNSSWMDIAYSNCCIVCTSYRIFNGQFVSSRCGRIAFGMSYNGFMDMVVYLVNEHIKWSCGISLAISPFKRKPWFSSFEVTKNIYNLRFN